MEKLQLARAKTCAAAGKARHLVWPGNCWRPHVLAAALPRQSYVLVVDDTETIREAVVELLREEGIVAIGFANGADALAHLRSGAELPVAILTDLMMPVLDGWELVAQLRADDVLSGIRVVAMTANPMCAGPRAVRLLRKPFHVAELLGALEGG